MPGDPGPADRARLAAEALARAKEDARKRGEGLPVPGRPVRRGHPPPGAGPAQGAAPPTATAPGAAAGNPAAGAAVPGSAPPGGSAPGGSPPAADSAPSGAVLPGGPLPGSAGAGRPAGPRQGGRAAQGGRPRRARRDDPELLRSAIHNLLDDRGWRDDLAVGGVFGRWDQIVGPELAAHTRPDGFSGGELLVTADSTAWATQVRLLAATLVARVNAELGNTVVRRVKVRGPAPPPPAGPWRVRGGRGPRGDYG